MSEQEQQTHIGDDGEIINDLLHWDLSWDHEVWEDAQHAEKHKRSSWRVRLGNSPVGHIIRLLAFGVAVWGCAWSIGLSYVAFKTLDVAQCPVQVMGIDVQAGKIAFASAREGAYNIYVMNADGSNRLRLTAVKKNGSNVYPRISPDGKRIFFQSHDPSNGISTLEVIGVDGSSRHLIGDMSGQPLGWIDEQHIALIGGQNMMYVTDVSGVNRRNVKQLPYNFWQDSHLGLGSRFIDVQFSNHVGKLFAFDVSNANERYLTDVAGDQIYNPIWSPDGNHLALLVQKADSNGDRLWSLDADGSNLHQVSTSIIANFDGQLDWSPDSTRVAFVSSVDGYREIHTVKVDGSDERFLTSDENDNYYARWIDDKHIVFVSDRDGHSIYVIDADGSNEHRLCS